jgi:hypothetical protein
LVPIAAKYWFKSHADFDGNSRNADGLLFGEFNQHVKWDLITRNDSAITSGPLAGALAVTDGSGGEIVIFRLDSRPIQPLGVKTIACGRNHQSYRYSPN